MDCTSHYHALPRLTNIWMTTSRTAKTVVYENGSQVCNDNNISSERSTVTLINYHCQQNVDELPPRFQCLKRHETTVINPQRCKTFFVSNRFTSHNTQGVGVAPSLLFKGWSNVYFDILSTCGVIAQLTRGLSMLYGIRDPNPATPQYGPH